MLSSLHIENIALIRKADLELPAGFTALTGETGAGKTLMMTSVGLLVGERAERDIVRHGAERATVSGLFTDLSRETTEVLERLGITTEEDGALLITRTVTPDGKSTVRLNGRAATLGMLREIGASLLAIHGQSDTHSLTDPRTHLLFLDRYAENENLQREYGIAFSHLEKIRKEIREIKEKESERERLLEMLAYQIKDIDEAALHSGEEEELVEKKCKIKNSERIAKHANFVYRALRGSEKGSVSFLLDRSVSSLEQLTDIFPQFEEYAQTLRDDLYHITDIAEEVFAVLDREEQDPDRVLNDIESRLDKIAKLKRKYGYTVDDILAFRENAAAEYEKLSNAGDTLAALEKEEKAAYEAALALAVQLHGRRKNAAVALEESVKETLAFLDMPKVVFYADLRTERDGEAVVLRPDGMDRTEFFISANRGAAPQPLAKIASGGELARLMLALKGAIAGKDGVSTLIFDEIDAGVSGKTARKIGMKLAELSENTQILCVTHSAQIASLGDRHLLIRKCETDGGTETVLTVLDREGRIAELSRILGGITVTEAQKRAAVDMLDGRESYSEN